MTGRSSWGLPLRLARRDAVRNWRQSVLAVLMIALPVFGVSAADIVFATRDVSGAESLDRRLGSADARISWDGSSAVTQAFDPEDGVTSTGSILEGRRLRTRAEVAQLEKKISEQVARKVSAMLGARLVEERHGELFLRTDDGVADGSATEVDLRDPVTRGLFDLTSGRWPADRNEVVVNQAMLDQGYQLGERLGLVGAHGNAPRPMIVGTAESATKRSSPVAAGPIGSLGLTGPVSWLVAAGPISWKSVKELNALGAAVLSRAVLADPPPESELPVELRPDRESNDGDRLGMVVAVVIALLEVALLAGPAFAVSARRQSRTLALMTATGGTPAQSRKVVIGGALVLGTTAALSGAGTGVVAAWLLMPFVQAKSETFFGPFEVPWAHVAGLALFALVSALLAAVVPAWIASRQDVVAVLGGRRHDARPSLRSPVAGVVLLAAAIAGSSYVATTRAPNEVIASLSIVAAMAGMLLLVPVVVAGVARCSARLPLSPRYAARDAARHRTRTVPAVAAVAATVSGVVGLGIVAASYASMERSTYQPAVPLGLGTLTAAHDDHTDWTPLRAAVERELPDTRVTTLSGIPPSAGVKLRAAGWAGTNPTASPLGSSVLVADSVPQLGYELPATHRARAAESLRGGGVVLLTRRRVEAGAVQVTVRRCCGAKGSLAQIPGYVVKVPDWFAGHAILSEQTARHLDLPVGVVSLVVQGPISEEEQKAADEALTQAGLRSATRWKAAGYVESLDESFELYVERGHQSDDDSSIIMLVLGSLAGTLMLGGTLTATFLSLSDARPDLATLSAVGASPRRRRSIAVSYTLVVALVGSTLGAIVGSIPGLAMSYSLTHGASGIRDGQAVDVPWLLLAGIVLGLPGIAALIVAALTRARLPLVTRMAG